MKQVKVNKTKIYSGNHFRKDHFKKEKTEISKKKLKFNITYYPAFKNFRNILQELHFSLTPDKE